MAAFLGVIVAFLIGVLLATAFLTGLGGPVISGALLLTLVSALVVLTTRAVRWSSRYAVARSQTRAHDFGKYAVPQATVTDDTALPA